MVICIDVSERTKQELDSLLEVGKYRDYTEAVSIAISNQLVLDRQISKSGTPLVRGKTEASMGRASQLVSSQADRDKERRRAAEVPVIFSSRASNERLFEPIPLPDDVFAPGQPVPVDRWIFGQHNKLLPAKASCRALASLLNERENGGQGVLLSKAAAEIADQAVRLGDYLRVMDEKFELNRDDAFATAFPHSGAESEDKARLRYSNQFVAAMSKQGRLTGFLIDLKLINHARSRTPKILLTQAGLDFARLANPLLDLLGSDKRPPKFSEEEINFLVEHIVRHVPAEDSAYRTILGAVLDGKDTPEKLDTVLKQHLSPRSDKPFTDAFITTQRSGAISRMADLGLVDRIRDGIRVTYVVTNRGNLYLKDRAAAGVGHE